MPAPPDTHEPEHFAARAPVSRRAFLAAGAAGVGAAALGQAPARDGVRAERPAPRSGAPSRPARNVIFLISDGMSAGTLTLADLFIRQRDGRPSRWRQWISGEGAGGAGAARPYRALLDTDCADSLVTDSAAASSAWNIGRRVVMGALNITPEGEAVEPLWRRAQRAGLGVGVVTTTRITHATPAGFLAQIHSRDLEDDIARQYIDAAPDVALGGGARHFPDELLRSRAGVIVRDAKALAGAASQGALQSGLFGVFSASHMAHEVERPPEQPSLADMTRAALRALERAPGGFALHVEGGRVDHAAHRNCAAGLLFDQAAFDEALGVALDFALGRDPADTLVICTTDHGNANPGLLHYGREGAERFARTRGMRRSVEWIAAQIRTLEPERRAGDAVRNIIEHAAGVRISENELAFIGRWLRGERPDVLGVRNDEMCPIGNALANHVGVGFLGPNHTSDAVECTAWGPGAEGVPACSHLSGLCAVVERALDLPPAVVARAPDVPAGAPPD